MSKVSFLNSKQHSSFKERVYQVSFLNSKQHSSFKERVYQVKRVPLMFWFHGERHISGTWHAHLPLHRSQNDVKWKRNNLENHMTTLLVIMHFYIYRTLTTALDFLGNIALAIKTAIKKVIVQYKNLRASIKPLLDFL